MDGPHRLDSVLGWRQEIEAPITFERLPDGFDAGRSLVHGNGDAVLHLDRGVMEAVPGVVDDVQSPNPPRTGGQQPGVARPRRSLHAGSLRCTRYRD